jgi:hypothetical protein
MVTTTSRLLPESRPTEAQAFSPDKARRLDPDQRVPTLQY